MRALIVGCLTTLGFAVCDPSHAYPIRPRTLWELVAEAELIVVADVVGVVPPGLLSRIADRSCRRLAEATSVRLDCDVFDVDSSEATLAIREVWKGDAPR